ncbi:phospholipase D-like domain-containing protein [Pseudomonas sp. RT4P38]
MASTVFSPPKLHKTTVINGNFCILCREHLDKQAENKVICHDCRDFPNKLEKSFCNCCGVLVHQKLSIELLKEHIEQDYFCQKCFDRCVIEQIYEKMYEKHRESYYKHFEIFYCKKCDGIENSCDDKFCKLNSAPPSNLNKLRAFGNKSVNLATLARPTNAHGTGTEAYFDNIADELNKNILNSDAILGCVCYIKDASTLENLSKKPCQIIMQKPKKTLRPPQKGELKFDNNSILSLSGILKQGIELSEIEGFPSEKFVETHISPLRVIGSEDGFPLMHHKFLIFLKRAIDSDNGALEKLGQRCTLKPYAVWTGSFNLTYNAKNSLENAVLIKEAAIIQKYLEEYAFSLSVSESPENYASSVLPDLNPIGMKLIDIFIEQ